MLVEKDWFRALIDGLLAAGDRAVVTGRVLPGPEARAGGFVPALVSDSRPATYAGRLDRDVLAGGHMAAHRATFAEIGGFDERLGAGSAFPAADDNDLGFRLLAAGYRIVYLPEAIVYHRAWRPQREYLTMRWRYGRGKGGFYAKHGLGRRIVRDIGRRVLAFPRRLLGEPRRAAGDAMYSMGILVGILQWSLRQRLPRGLPVATP
jgi:GT2 family glycosyltransferase